MVGRVLGADGEPEVRASHAVFVVAADAAEVQARVAERLGHLRVMSAGSTIEIYKEMGRPEDFVARFALDDVRATHGLGHTRMATESRVTTQHSHPFSTGLDLCLVHNGSLSNHNRLRRELRRAGIAFQTDNDHGGRRGLPDLAHAGGRDAGRGARGLPARPRRLLHVRRRTVDGFAVLRDPIACKPAVLAETDDWVAMASEYRAIAVLPGAEQARVWEPAPATVYAWEQERVR